MSGYIAGFTRRFLDVTFTLEPTEGQLDRKFSHNGKNAVTLSGHRCRATVVKQGEGVQASLNLSVWGVPLSIMNELSTLRVLPGELRNNIVTVEAGDETGPMSVVYRGAIVHGWANMNAQPLVSFEVVGLTGQYEDLAPATATSFAGGVSVATIVSGIATRMGRAFVNHGVDTMLAAPYLSGTLLEQLRRACADAGVEFVDEGDVIHLYPRRGSRGGSPPLIAPHTGMLGYPSYTSGGLDVTTLFNPSVQHGGLIQVESSMRPACGEWAVLSMTHDLESETPGGSWFTTIRAANPAQAPVSTRAPR